VRIAFRTSKLARLCNETAKAQRKYGAEAATKLRRRLDDLDAVPSLDDFKYLPGDCEELKADRRGQLSLKLTGGLRLIFTPDHDPPPVKPDGGLDWTAVTAVRIEEIVDYHG
jgi:proteic killer suppression protein